MCVTAISLLLVKITLGNCDGLEIFVYEGCDYSSIVPRVNLVTELQSEV